MTKNANFPSITEMKKLTNVGLSELSDKIRSFMIHTISETGGHIGANLGTVDLTVALHYIFNSPLDKIIWDTGHQGYTHKILTGRADNFKTLNQYEGMNRFVTNKESEHDIIEASHAGTSISIALGIALSNKLQNNNHFSIAVIGDGALCEGLALEALNHAAVEREVNLIVVLNDNGFAISPGFGGIHEYLQTKVVGDNSQEFLFSALGYDYIGPVDGHSSLDLAKALEKAKASKKIPFVHVKTIKGYGLPAASQHPYKMHFSFPYDSETGQLKDLNTTIGYQDIAASVIESKMLTDKTIVAITPSTLYATGLTNVFNKFPDRTFDPGMEEQHAMTMTVGFALSGCKPIVFYQSTFLQRAYDQLFHDVCFSNLPILILSVRTGFAGYDNPTHHGIYDFAYMRGLPNLTVLYPKDKFELERMLSETIDNITGPTIICMPYGAVDELDQSIINETEEEFHQAQIIDQGNDLAIITVGNKYKESYKVYQALKQKGIDCSLVNLRYIKPLPESQLIKMMSEKKYVVTVEEGVLDGGVGSAIGALILDNDLKCKLLRVGLPCAFIEGGSQDELCRKYKIDSASILNQIEKKWF